MDVVLQTQTAVYGVLKGDSTLAGLIMDIYDFVPDGAAYPYVTIGESTVKDSSDLAAKGYEVDLDVNVYSESAGRKEVLAVTERIRELIDGQVLVISGYQFIAANFVAFSTGRLANSDISGRISFKILLKDNE